MQQHFQSHGSVELGIMSLVDYAKSAAVQFFDDFVAVNRWRGGHNTRTWRRHKKPPGLTRREARSTIGAQSGWVPMSPGPGKPLVVTEGFFVEFKTFQSKVKTVYHACRLPDNRLGKITHASGRRWRSGGEVGVEFSICRRSNFSHHCFIVDQFSFVGLSTFLKTLSRVSHIYPSSLSGKSLIT